MKPKGEACPHRQLSESMPCSWHIFGNKIKINCDVIFSFSQKHDQGEEDTINIFQSWLEMDMKNLGH